MEIRPLEKRISQTKRNLPINGLVPIIFHSKTWIKSLLNPVRKLWASFVAISDGDLAAVRLTLLPSTWICHFERGLTPARWGIDPTKVAYFKSLFVADEFRGKGLGPQLTEASLKVLREIGAEAVLCHSWLESPETSSQRYLEKIGFELVSEWPKFWYPIDYQCTRCAPARCECTAGEMILKL